MNHRTTSLHSEVFRNYKNYDQHSRNVLKMEKNFCENEDPGTLHEFVTNSWRWYVIVSVLKRHL